MCYLIYSVKELKSKMNKLQVDIEETCRIALFHSEELDGELIKANLNACEACEHLDIALDILTNGDKTK